MYCAKYCKLIIVYLQPIIFWLPITLFFRVLALDGLLGHGHYFGPYSSVLHWELLIQSMWVCLISEFFIYNALSADILKYILSFMSPNDKRLRWKLYRINIYICLCWNNFFDWHLEFDVILCIDYIFIEYSQSRLMFWYGDSQICRPFQFTWIKCSISMWL